MTSTNNECGHMKLVILYTKGKPAWSTHLRSALWFWHWENVKLVSAQMRRRDRNASRIRTSALPCMTRIKKEGLP